MTKQVFILSHDLARRNAVAAVSDAPPGFKVIVSEPSRSLDQNAAQWPILQAFSDQLTWPVNGQMVKLEPEEWKDLLTVAYRQETVRIAMGLNGGMVMLGCRTSKMSKQEFSEYLDFLHSEAAARGVIVYAEDECTT